MYVKYCENQALMHFHVYVKYCENQALMVRALQRLRQRPAFANELKRLPRVRQVLREPGAHGEGAAAAEGATRLRQRTQEVTPSLPHVRQVLREPGARGEGAAAAEGATRLRQRTHE
ncbi:Rho guanine nucleotide exchange factor 16, partial [Operophtera brumata]